MLGFGLLTALSTSFGQTFFIALFLPHFQQSFSLSKSDFGLLYGVGTLLSALSLPWLGSRIDTANLPRYTGATLAGLAAACLLMALSPHFLALGLAILGVRLMGHGLLAHISQTVMAREFGANRGKALGIAGLGYPLGEALLPITFTLLLRALGWREAWLLVAVFIAGVLLPLVLRLLRAAPAPPVSELPGGAEVAPFSRKQILRDPRLYLTLPAVLVLPFVLTGLFLFQAPLAESKGWAYEWMAAAFAGFAISRAVCSLLSGPLIDRFSATRLLPFYMAPLVAGIAVLIVGQSPWAAFIYMILVGATTGASSNIASAVWAEFYGAANVGTVRSVSAALAVLSTAASPALMGWMFHLGATFDDMLWGAIVMTVLASAISLSVTPWGEPVRERLALAVARVNVPRWDDRAGG
jgi:MFS family permease